MRWYRDGIRLTDSKQMIERARIRWEQETRIMLKEGTIKIGISFCTAQTIDTKGIAWCVRKATTRAITQLTCNPDECTVLLDGGLRAPEGFQQKTVVKGDVLHPIISLASVVSKFRRDTKMQKLHKHYPAYLLIENKWYGTAIHIRALKKKGPSPLHRKSFISNLI